jgi:hypothetical protein
MVHNFIWVIHEATDEFGWQYRHQWPTVSRREEQVWTSSFQANSRVRRRVWMTTVVPKQDLVKAKRYLYENLMRDDGNPILTNDLNRYEKGTLTNTWHKRKVVLFRNRLEFYSSNNKKAGDIPLQDVDVIIMNENNVYNGRKFIFSIRNPSGSVALVLDAESELMRRKWVMTLQYYIAINTPDLSFPPFLYSPPIRDPAYQVLISGDLMVLAKDNKTWVPNYFQLLPRELVYFQRNQVKGRFFTENAIIQAEDKTLSFTLRTASGITLSLMAGNREAKNIWVATLRRSLQSIENVKLKLKTYPKEESLAQENTGLTQLALYREESAWRAQVVNGETNEYFLTPWSILLNNIPAHEECSEELEINQAYIQRLIAKEEAEAAAKVAAANAALAARQSQRHARINSATYNAALLRPLSQQQTIPVAQLPRPVSSASMNASTHGSEDTSSIGQVPALSLPVVETIPKAVVIPKKPLHSNRIIINPRFVLGALKGITHRFILVLENQFRHEMHNQTQVAQTTPARFVVGGPRASKDPRTVPLNQLIGITSESPEVQLPSGKSYQAFYLKILFFDFFLFL